MGGHAAAEGLWSNGHAHAAEFQALPFERLVLEILVGGGLDDQAIAEHAALDDSGQRRGGDDDVIELAFDGLVDALHDDDLGRNDVEVLAVGMPHRFHLDAALGTQTQSARHAIEQRNALERRREVLAPGVLSLAALRRLLFPGLFTFRRSIAIAGCGRLGCDAHRPRQLQLAFQAPQSLGTWSSTAKLHQLLRQLRVEVPQASDQRNHPGDLLREGRKLDELFEPRLKLVDVARTGYRRLRHAPLACPQWASQSPSNSSIFLSPDQPITWRFDRLGAGIQRGRRRAPSRSIPSSTSASSAASMVRTSMVSSPGIR